MSDEVPTDPWGNPDPGLVRPSAPPLAQGPPPGWPTSTPGATPPDGHAGPAPAATPHEGVPAMGWGSAPPPGGSVPMLPKRDGQAVGSLVLGVLSLLCVGFIGMFFGSGAVITGALSRRRITESGGALEGRGMATAGIVLGAIGAVVGTGFFIYTTFINPDFAADLLEQLTPTTTVPEPPG